MKFKICWADAYFDKPDRLTDGIIRTFQEHGHTVTPFADSTYDFVINGSCYWQKAQDQLQKTLNGKLVNYCWDYYPWIANPGPDHRANYPAYANFLAISAEVWTPNTGTSKRLEEISQVKSVVLPFSIPVYNVFSSDQRFVLDPVRDYPDANLGWVEKACAELNIPYVHSNHQYDVEAFRKLVGECSIITCAYTEASTGGLTLIEGLWNGKPSLVSDSPFMGGTEYLKHWGHYFDYKSYEDMKTKLKDLWDNPPSINITDARKYIKANFSDEALYERMMTRLTLIKEKP